MLFNCTVELVWNPKRPREFPDLSHPHLLPQSLRVLLLLLLLLRGLNDLSHGGISSECL